MSCLLVTGAVGLRPADQATIHLGITPEQTEYMWGTSDTVAETGDTLPAIDVAVRSAGTYLETSSRLDYQATVENTSKLTTYTVQPGDSLWIIAEAYGTDISTLLSLNPHIDGTVIQPDDVLHIVPNFRGAAHIVEQGETLSEIGEIYGLTVTEIATANALSSPDELQPEQLLLLPGAQPRPPHGMLASRSSDGRRATTGQAPTGWIWPINGGLYTTEFGQGGYHSGLDIAISAGTSVMAVAEGTVVFSGWDGGYGYSVILDHGNGLQTRYAHASRLLVTDGQLVGQGESVILVGSTGNSTGPHLHFEVLDDGTPRNPRSYLP